MTRPSTGALTAVSYNGFTFPPHINPKVEVEPIYDAAQKGVVANRYTITIACAIVGIDDPNPVAGAAVDGKMETIRALLSAPGHAFTFVGQGFGDDLYINHAKTSEFFPLSINDLEWGPKPEILLWEPLASKYAVNIVWTISFVIAPCGVLANKNALVTPLELTYEVTWDVNELGMTTRTIIGRLTRAISWNADPLKRLNLQYHVEQWRTRLKEYPLPPNFRRRVGVELSTDRRVLNFRITDTEITNDYGYPPGVVEMRAEHSVASTLEVSGGTIPKGGFNSWSSTISARITLAPGVPRPVAWAAFTQLVNSRLAFDKIGKRRSVLTHGSPPEETPGSNYIPLALDLREIITEREFDFSFRYAIITSLDNIFAASGLFQPVPWNKDQWWASIRDFYQSGLGHANLRHPIGERIIFNVCQTGNPPLYPQEEVRNPPVKPPEVPPDYQGPNPGTPNLPNNQIPGQQTFLQSLADPRRTWLAYWNSFKFYSMASTAALVSLNNAANDHANDVIDNLGLRERTDDTPLGGIRKKAIRTITRGENYYMMEVRGMAIRAGYAIAPPSIVRVGNMIATRVGSSMTSAPVTQSSLSPLYIGKWVAQYILSNKPVAPVLGPKNFSGTGNPKDYY